MCYSALQHIEVCCIVLQSVADITGASFTAIHVFLSHQCVACYCIVLQSAVVHIAVCCSVLQCVAACCSVLQRDAVCCSVFQCVADITGASFTAIHVFFIHQCVAGCYRVLQYVAVCGSVLQCVAVCCRVLQCVAVCCSVLHCIADITGASFTVIHILLIIKIRVFWWIVPVLLIQMCVAV